MQTCSHLINSSASIWNPSSDRKGTFSWVCRGPSFLLFMCQSLMFHTYADAICAVIQLGGCVVEEKLTTKAHASALGSLLRLYLRKDNTMTQWQSVRHPHCFGSTLFYTRLVYQNVLDLSTFHVTAPSLITNQTSSKFLDPVVQLC